MLLRLYRTLRACRRRRRTSMSASMMARCWMPCRNLLTRAMAGDLKIVPPAKARAASLGLALETHRSRAIPLLTTTADHPLAERRRWCTHLLAKRRTTPISRSVWRRLMTVTAAYPGCNPHLLSLQRAAASAAATCSWRRSATQPRRRALSGSAWSSTARSPGVLCWEVGPVGLAAHCFGPAESCDDAFARLSPDRRSSSGRFCCPFAEAPIDVDKPADYTLVSDDPAETRRRDLSHRDRLDNFCMLAPVFPLPAPLAFACR